MTLYYAITPFHLLGCLVRRMGQPRGDRSVLIVSDLIPATLTTLDALRQERLFDQVLVLPEQEIVLRHIGKAAPPLPVAEAIARIAGEVRAAISSVDLARFDEIVLGADHYPFGWTIISAGLPYVYLEDGAGMYSRLEYVLDHWQGWPKLREVLVQLGAFGRNPSAVQVLGNLALQDPDAIDERFQDFPVVELIEGLRREQQLVLLRVFGGGDVAAVGQDVPTTLLLTQPFAFVGGSLSCEEQHALVAASVDYLTAAEFLLIKPHPRDYCPHYEQVLSVPCVLLPPSFPSELLPFCGSGRFAEVLSLGGTAANSLSSTSERVITLAQSITAEFPQLHRAWAAAEARRHLARQGIDAWPAVAMEADRAFAVGCRAAPPEETEPVSQGGEPWQVTLQVSVSGLIQLREEIVLASRDPRVVTALASFSAARTLPNSWSVARVWGGEVTEPPEQDFSGSDSGVARIVELAGCRLAVGQEQAAAQQQALREQLRRAKAETARLRSSVSWRLTAPVRVTDRLLRRLRFR
ncbi:MAG: glycosyltransferase family 52 protein [Promicromonosporaceae bacterium]|nr:glycosyltransferase family 52 protein [Promicromonosporaceae bacterium]